MGQVTASVTIGFATAASASNNSFVAEVDSREDGLNGGVTQFTPGSSIYLLLYKGSDVTNVTATPSDGSISQGGTITITKTETVSMANSDSFNTQYPITGTYTLEWYGASSPTVTKVGENAFTSGTKQIAVGKITYQTTASIYILSGVDVTYPAAVVVFFGVVP